MEKSELTLNRVSLCGVTGLCDVLPQLSFPTPLPAIHEKSLLFSSLVTDKSKVLSSKFSDLLLNHVTEAIDNVTTQHIELKTKRNKVENTESYSDLVQTILTRTPQVFNNIAGVARNKKKIDVSVDGACAKEQATPTKTSFMMDDLLDKKKTPSKPEEKIPKKSKKQLETEELDFLLAQSLAGGSIGASVRTRRSRVNRGASAGDDSSPNKSSNSDPKIKPKHMKKSTAQPAKFNLKKHQKKKSYAISSSDEEDNPAVNIDPEDLKPENISEPAPEPDDLVDEAAPSETEEITEDQSIAPPIFEDNELLIEKDESQGDRELIEDSEYVGEADQLDEQIDEDLQSNEEDEEDEEYIPKTKSVKKINLLKKDNGKTKTLRDIKVERAEKRKNEAKQAKQQLINEDDMSDPLQSASFKRFSKLLDIIFEHEDEMVPENFKLGAVDDDEFEPSPETLLSLRKLELLSAEGAKLKQMRVLNCIPQDRLVRLLNILDRHIRDSVHLSLNPEPETLDEDLYTYQKQTLCRMQVSAEAAIASFHILTSPDMPKAVYLEDVIERTVMYLKFHLTNGIYPAYDLVYADPKGKDDGQSVKSKRKKSIMPTNKLLVSVYNRIVELMELIPGLLNVQTLPDTLVLQISTLSVSPFFVENVGTLQLAALSVCRGIFCLYEKHRQIILDDIFSSLARLPSSKRNFRSYTLSNGESIQMVTALVLQLIQCIIKVPEAEEKKEPVRDLEPKEQKMDQNEDSPRKGKKKRRGKKGRRSGKKSSEDERPPSPPPADAEKAPDVQGIVLENGASTGASTEYYAPDADVLIVTSYEQALQTAHHFLYAFLRKCSAKEQEDYRPLFENFIEDLLICLNLPEWPSAENVLNLLGRLLVATFSSKHSDFAMRTVTIEYLGNIAAHLRRDAVNSRSDSAKLKQVLVEQWTHENNEVEDACPLFKDEEKPQVEMEEEDSGKTSILLDHITELQLILLAFLVEHSDINPELVHARRFYLGQWIRDAQITCEQLVTNPPKPPAVKGEEEEATEEEIKAEHEQKVKKQMIELEEKKDRLKNLLQKDIIKPSTLKSQRWSVSGSNAVRIAQFLASSRSLSINFDIYLNKILIELQESAIGLRTKAMKALAAIISADPNLLHRNELRLGVHGRFMDQAASVREAAVDLVGRFVLDKPQLTLQYYPMLSERILDKGVGVRKRVIKILRDICVQQPDFPKLTEICIKLIRRINDEDGIREVVAKVFLDLWFTEQSEETPDGLIKRVVSITEAVAESPDQNCDWFKLLLNQYLKPGDENTTDKDEEKRVRITAQSKKMIDCLVDSVLKLENFSASCSENSSRLVSCLHTIYLFAEAVPHLVSRHCTTLHPYLNMKCSQQIDYLVLYHVTQTLQIVLPLMEHPSEEFLASVEEDMITLVMRYGQLIVQACISCLGVIINNTTHNFKLAQDCFKKFFICLAQYKKQYTENPEEPSLEAQKGLVIRSLFTVGLLCQHFEFDQGKQSKAVSSIQNQVYDILMFFAGFQDEEIRNRAISGLGFFFIRYDKMMLKEQSRQLYIEILKGFDAPVKLKCQVLKNLQLHLMSDEKRLTQQNQAMRKELKRDGITDLKTYGDEKSSVSGAVAQMLLEPIHHCFFHKLTQVRSAAVQVVCQVLHQGLLHPISCIQYLVAICTDIDEINRIKAEQTLIELDGKYPLFLHSQFFPGLRESFKLQTALFSTYPVRGFRNNPPISLLSHVYALIRSSKAHRHSQLVTMIKQFDDYKRTDINLLLYIADNLAHMSYQIVEEPLFVIHHVALLISTSGTTYLEQAKDAVYGRDVAETIKDEDEENIDDIDQVEDLPRLTEVLVSCQSCTLLILLKKHLMTQYNLTDKRCHEFSPLEPAKIYDKQISRHSNLAYDPSPVLSAVQQLTLDVDYESEEFEKSALLYYKEFRDLMTQQDLAEFKCSDSDNDDPEKSVKYYERRKELPVKVRKERKPRVSKAPAKEGKKRKLSKTPAKKTPKKKRRRYVVRSDSEVSEQDDEDDEDYEGETVAAPR